VSRERAVTAVHVSIRTETAGLPMSSPALWLTLLQFDGAGLLVLLTNSLALDPYAPRIMNGSCSLTRRIARNRSNVLQAKHA